MKNFLSLFAQEIAYLFSFHKRAMLMLCFIPLLSCAIYIIHLAVTKISS